jgi:glycosyltransferase involved in cell wall biosynthesis
MHYRICLITPRHISYNPRLVKEADVLHEAGYEVRVVALSHTSKKDELDDRLMKPREWTLETVTVHQSHPLELIRWFKASVRQKLSQAVHARTLTWLRDKAYSRYVSELSALAGKQQADLYIAHNLQALPAAFRAAQQHDTLLGFDAEDFHRGEFAADDGSQRKRLTEQVEARYLSYCDHITAASEGIAGAYAAALNIPTPTVVLNTFPKKERRGHTPEKGLDQEKEAGTISLYWYSQTIGPDRGLQDVVRTLPALDERVVLTIRGQWADGFESVFRDLARGHDVENRLRVLPPAPPDQLVERAAQHDIGLALEQAHTPNRDLCVTNKILAYLLAGIPVVATDTTGQQRICETIPDASRVVPIGNAEAIANAVQDLTATDAALAAAKEAAYKAGDRQYNWDIEKQRLVQALNSLMEK